MSETLQGIEFEKLTAKDALDLAILIEEEAHERYLLLARHVGGRYAGDASDAFRTMAVNEARHGTELAQRRHEVFGDARRSVTRGMLYQVEAPDMGSVRTFMSAQQAWEVALACETKAREFFERALESVREPQVRALFAALRDEEVQHEAWVRARMEKLPPGPDVDEDAADEPGSDPGG